MLLSQAVTATATCTLTPASTVTGCGLRTRRHGYGCESCDTSHFGDKRGGRTHEVTACRAKRVMVIGSRYDSLLLRRYDTSCGVTIRHFSYIQASCCVHYRLQGKFPLFLRSNSSEVCRSKCGQNTPNDPRPPSCDVGELRSVGGGIPHPPRGPMCKLR